MNEMQTVVNPESDRPVVVARSAYRGVERLDVRHYYYTRAGELKPTKKGVSLPVSDGLAAATLAAMRSVVEAAEGADPVVLDGENAYPVVIRYNAYRGRLYLDLRRHYVSSDELRPTKKGVSLPVDTGLHDRVMLAMAELLKAGD